MQKCKTEQNYPDTYACCLYAKQKSSNLDQPLLRNNFFNEETQKLKMKQGLQKWQCLTYCARMHSRKKLT